MIDFRLQRFYWLGISFGKVLDISNVNNLTYTMLLVFEEYDILTKKRGVFGASLEESTILRLILPHSLDNLSKQNESQAKRYIEHD